MRYLMFLFVFITLSLQAQNEFPESWTGTWKGELSWFTPGAKTPQTVPMEIRISPLKDSLDQYHWDMVYANDYNAIRAYFLKAVNKANGKWLIDENNGILLEQFLYGNCLSGVFKVENSVIVNNYRMEQDQLTVEFYSYKAEPSLTSGGKSEDIPPVESFTVLSYQRAVLKRN